MFILMGLAMVFWEPRSAPRPFLLWASIALVLWCAIPFLPAGWLSSPAWRHDLEAVLGHALAPTHTAQPWLTLGAWLTLGSVVAWVVWLDAQDLGDQERTGVLKIYLLGFAGVALAGLICQIAGVRPPLWEGIQPGPFPNRNQSANVLALAGVAALALGMRQLHHGRRHGWIWLGAVGFFLGLLLLLGSRAGFILFFCGAAAWLGWEFVGSRKKNHVVAGVVLSLFLLAATLFIGGETVDRLLHAARDQTTWQKESRLLLQHDALDMVRDQPVLGLGLGNFDGVFGLYRDRYQNYSRPIHPESDWVWWMAETGVPGAVLLIVLAGWLLRVSWPGAVENDRRLRRAAIVVLLLFMVHAAVDVPAHRLGSILAVLFFLPLALPAKSGSIPAIRVRAGFMLAGVTVAVWGFLLAGMSLGWFDLPGQVRRERLMSEAEAHDQASRHAEALECALEGQKMAPLDWRLYRQEGFSRLGLNQGGELARRAFRLVRALEPDSPFVQYQIGVAWLGRDPAQVIAAWDEALKRRSQQRTSFYLEMLGASGRDPRVRPLLDRMAADYPELDIFNLARARAEDFEGHLERILAHAPSYYKLPPDGMDSFFEAWRERRGNLRFIQEICARPDWMNAGWWTLARAHVALKQPHRAMELAKQNLIPPVLPRLDLDEDKAREILRKHPDDVPAGLALYEWALRSGDGPTARKRLDVLLGLKDKPVYLHYLDAMLCMKEGRDAAGWEALERFRQASAQQP
ncbi:MAG: O-antigen ligase family protein [Candidatus Methylacidiphilales bacterium]|nr:O-antigen ligase family protein [Candidatus Methylacidiphilales bacterium]